MTKPKVNVTARRVGNRVEIALHIGQAGMSALLTPEQARELGIAALNEAADAEVVGGVR